MLEIFFEVIIAYQPGDPVAPILPQDRHACVGSHKSPATGKSAR
jgi:hypothetical protein